MRTTTELPSPRCNCAFALERRLVLLTRPCRRVPTKGGGLDAGADSTPHTQTDPSLSPDNDCSGCPAES